MSHWLAGWEVQGLAALALAVAVSVAVGEFNQLAGYLGFWLAGWLGGWVVGLHSSAPPTEGKQDRGDW